MSVGIEQTRITSHAFSCPPHPNLTGFFQHEELLLRCNEQTVSLDRLGITRCVRGTLFILMRIAEMIKEVTDSLVSHWLITRYGNKDILSEETLEHVFVPPMLRVTDYDTHSPFLWVGCFFPRVSRTCPGPP